MSFWEKLETIGGIVLSGLETLNDEVQKTNEIQRERIEKDFERKKRAAESSINHYEKTHHDLESKKKVAKAREMLNNADLYSKGSSSYNSDRTNNFIRRTDAELERDKTGTDQRPEDFQFEKKIALKDAISECNSEPGVYILYLNGSIMKCGRASMNGGVRMRLRQYYNLNYDNRARKKDYWSVSPENKDKIVVSWQCCPISKCHELEYKLFIKYGKGKWAKRAPASCTTDSWKLLI